jgi:hypothetical protein
MLRTAVALAALAVSAVATADPAPAPSPPPAPAPAPADDVDRDHATAMAAFDAGDFQAAYDQLTRVYETSHRYDLLFDIARSEKHLGRFRAAIKTFGRYLKEGGAQVTKEQHEAAIAEIVDIHKSAAEVMVTVEGGPATLEVDGHPEDPAPLDGPLLLTPGHHHVVATRGAARDEKEFDVVLGEIGRLRLIPFALDTKPTLTVRTDPDGASLTVDDEPRGYAPWSGMLEAGIHKVIASKSSYIMKEQDVTLVNGQKLDLPITLVHAPVTPPRWYQHWYVYAGAAVVVGAIAGVTTYALTRNDDLTITYH